MAMINSENSVLIDVDQLQPVYAESTARCDCFAGGKNADANATASNTSLVTGVKDAFITTASLTVYAKATGSTVRNNPSTGGGFIVFGGSGGSANNNIKRHIDWESTTILLGEPNPEIEIDATGKVVTLTNVTGIGPNGVVLAEGATIGGSGAIVLDDIIYDESSFVLFETDEHNGMPQSEIWGNAAIFDFQQTWDSVKIRNYSLHDIVINDIDVSLPPASNTITINVKNAPNTTDKVFRSASAAQDVGLGDEFNFEIINSYIPTVVEVLNLQNANAPPAENGWDILLNGVIHNAIGSTKVQTLRGDIEYVDGVYTNPYTLVDYANPNLNAYGDTPHYVNVSDQLIRTNVLDLDASGSIGAHADPNTARFPINIELIESDYTDCGKNPDGDPIEDCTPPDVGTDTKRRLPHGTYTPDRPVFTRYIVVTADAGGDIVLDVQSFRHVDADRAVTDPFVIDFGPINAGDDLDIFIDASYDRTNPGPALTTHVHRAKHAADFVPDQYNRFFRPDCDLPYHGGSPCTVHELANFATGTTPVTAHYLFASGYTDYDSDGKPSVGDRPTGVTPWLNAGDDISVRHLSSQHNANGPVTFTGIVDADNSTDSDGIGNVTLLTNGFINVEERKGDLRIDAIWSSADDVTIWALGAVIDDEDDPQTTPDPYSSITSATPTTGTDIRGVDITIYAGQPLENTNGGVGSAGNYVEIDVDVNNSGGVLNVFDVTSGFNTPGVFLAETAGDLRLDTVWTTLDVSMYTIDGNIVDARLGIDHEVNVLGQTIDLDANDWDGNNASIGTLLNDVEIDSRRGSGAANDDVSLEADDSIYVTEADATASYDVNGDTNATTSADEGGAARSAMRLVLARAYNGDIRLTVRDQESVPGQVEPEDDDLILLPTGDFQRAEDDLLDTTDIPNGTIIARLGNVELQVGDDIDLHENSRTLAGMDIDIYGDSAYAGTVAGSLGS
jgi:hypothetical protein